MAGKPIILVTGANGFIARRIVLELLSRAYAVRGTVRDTNRSDEIRDAIRPHLKAEDDGKFAAIDIETGRYEIDEDELAACDKLNARRPDAQIWLVRIGSPWVHRFGGRELRGTP